MAVGPGNDQTINRIVIETLIMIKIRKRCLHDDK
jgi:hypothetical protein